MRPRIYKGLHPHPKQDLFSPAINDPRFFRAQLFLLPSRVVALLFPRPPATGLEAPSYTLIVSSYPFKGSRSFYAGEYRATMYTGPNPNLTKDDLLPSVHRPGRLVIDWPMQPCLKPPHPGRYYMGLVPKGDATRSALEAVHQAHFRLHKRVIPEFYCSKCANSFKSAVFFRTDESSHWAPIILFGQEVGRTLAYKDATYHSYCPTCNTTSVAHLRLV